jgi:DNA repair protein RecO (recombination protein O)
MRVQQQPAYVIHHHDYSETSLLLELFTRDYGRIGLIAKGARRAKNGRRALLNPFTPLLIDWSGKGELGVLTGVEASGAPLVLSGEALYCGFYVNELLIRLLHRHDAHAQLFGGYQQCLQRLLGDGTSDVALRQFEYLLLQEIGYGLVLDHDAFDNMPIEEDQHYEYIADSGPRRVVAGGERHDGALVQGRSLIALATGKLEDPAIMQELKRLMRMLLARHLGDKPLNSRQLMRALAQRPKVSQGETET